MKLRIITLITFISLAVASMIGAEPQRFALKVADFTTLKVVDPVNVDYKTNADSAGYIVFTCEPSTASYLLFEPGKKKLSVKLSTDYPTHIPLPTVTVYSSSLDKIENSGDSLVRVISPKCGEKFSAKLIGNGRLDVSNLNAQEVNGKIETGKGTLTIEGECTYVSLSSTGKGHIQADDLQAIDGKCSLWGTGSIGCNVRGKLTVVGLGSGTVFYSGQPREITNNGGGIKLKHLSL